MKLLSAFNSTFNGYIEPTVPIWNLVKDIPSLNSFYVLTNDYLHTSYVGTSTNNSNQLLVNNWYNLIGDTNYLYSVSGNQPQLIINDSQFNNKASIDFNNDGTDVLYLNNPINIGTIIIVYLVRVSGAYIIYSPDTEVVGVYEYEHYDHFPPNDSQLWGNEALDGSAVYNAISRINGKVVSPTEYVPLNNPRILTVYNFSNSTGILPISGFGGQNGILGGITNGIDTNTNTNSVKGKIAAILTFSESIDLSLIESIEAGLATYYINYQGTVLSSTPSFRLLVGSVFNFDFSTILVDEWYSIESYTLISPLTIGLSFTGSVLSGYLNITYNGTITIQTTNSGGFNNTFIFNLVIVRADPIINSIPQSNNLTLILSANYSPIDNTSYGIYTDNYNNLTSWEDARRLNIPVLTPNTNPPILNISNTNFNNLNTVSFTGNSYIGNLTTSISGMTFVWVYEQTSYGIRNMLDTFPDIYGTGVLWTVSNSTNQTFGNTSVTALNVTVNRLAVNASNYLIPLNQITIIIATVNSGSSAISFGGLQNLRGNLAFFASWSIILDSNDINSLTNLLATTYFSSLAPIIVDSSTVYTSNTNVNIDLSKKVLDILGSTLTYTFIENTNDASITNNTLSFTDIEDEIIEFQITCTNSSNLSTLLSFYVDISVRTNSLYLSLKSLLEDNSLYNINYSFELILIPTNDSITTVSNSGITTVSEWEDYRLTGTTFNAIGNLYYTALSIVDNYDVIEYEIDGSSSLNLTGNITGQCFIVAYIKKEDSTGRAFLFGQDSTNNFSSGLNNYIFDISATSNSILESNNYVNGQLINNTVYQIDNIVLNTIIINSNSALSFDRIAQDRMFTDNSVKGYLALVLVLDKPITDATTNNNTLTIISAINKAIRDYYNNPKYLLLLHLDNNLVDSSSIGNNINGSLTFNNHYKFGGYSYQLVNNSSYNYITIVNNGYYAYLYEDFTISFWIAINSSLNSNDTLIIYSQTDLTIGIYGSNLFISNNLSYEGSYITYTLPSNFWNINYIFNFISICRQNNTLYLFYNGNLVNTASCNIEIRDYYSPVIIGQISTTLLTSYINVLIDEFMIYRRLALYTTNFSIPTSSYS